MSKSDNLCKLCLVRSLVTKINSPKGRVKIKPTEYLAGFQDLVLSNNIQEDVSSLFKLLVQIYPCFESRCHLRFNCATCGALPMIIQLDNRNQSQTLTESLRNLERNLHKSHLTHNGPQLVISEETSLIFLESSDGISVDTKQSTSFMGKLWQIKSIVLDSETIFNTADGLKRSCQTPVPSVIEKAKFIILEEANVIVKVSNQFEYSGRVEYNVLYERTTARRSDRHKASEKSRNRHLDSKEVESQML